MNSFKYLLSTKNNKQGFTIVELLIATAVFSVILLICATSIIAIGNNYQKGRISINTQDTSRSVIDNISQAIQYSATVPTMHIPVSGDADQRYAFCVGKLRYTYALNTKVTDTNHALIVDNNAFNACVPIPSGSTGTELLSKNMRLWNLDIRPVGPVYFIDMRVTYGDDDLIDTSNGQCKQITGSQYCASSFLTTAVSRRLN